MLCFHCSSPFLSLKLQETVTPCVPKSHLTPFYMVLKIIISSLFSEKWWNLLPWEGMIVARVQSSPRFFSWRQNLRWRRNTNIAGEGAAAFVSDADAQEKQTETSSLQPKLACSWSVLSSKLVPPLSQLATLSFWAQLCAGLKRMLIEMTERRRRRKGMVQVATGLINAINAAVRWRR